jgi:hypothetical protein
MATNAGDWLVIHKWLLHHRGNCDENMRTDRRASGRFTLHCCSDVVEKRVKIAEAVARIRAGVGDDGQAREFGFDELIDDRRGEAKGPAR